MIKPFDFYFDFVSPYSFLAHKEIRKIESTKEKKKLFLEIILPLVLEENNRIKLDRIKLFKVLNKKNNSNSEIKWLNSKFKQ